MNLTADSKKLFTERVTFKTGGASESWLQVKLSSKGLGDEHMAELGRFLDKLLPDVDPNSTEEAVWANIELAENVIGSTGLISVLDALDRKHVTCKCFKLYRNKIGDEGGVKLAESVRRQQSAVEEIHLSHNMFSARTLVALCMALGKHEGYPMVGRSRLYIPCWVRMEYNHIARPNDVLEMLRRDGPVTICTADNREDCGPWRCVCSSREKTAVPQVHLFTIANQSRRTVLHEDSEMRAEITKWGGEVKPVKRDDPTVRKPAPSVALGPRGAGPPAKAGSGCTTPTASVANAPPRLSPWDMNGALRRSLTAPPAVADTTNESDASGAKTPNSVEEVQRDSSPAPPPAPPPMKESGSNPDLGFPLSDKEDSPAREAVSDPESFDPPPRKTSPAAVNGSAPVQETAAEVLIKRLQASEGQSQAASNSTASRWGAGAPLTGGATPRGGPGDNTTSSHRKSMVVDGSGRRRILPKQLIEADTSAPFICPLCAFVIARPVITSCSHLFCEACFRSWVTDQVSKAKKNQSPDAPVPLVPCPLSLQNACTGKLRKQDIMLLDKADSTKVGAVALLQRLRNNLRVRCVHHCDHFKYSFGKDAERISKETGTKCEWTGDLTEYDRHVQGGCSIENRLCEKCPVTSETSQNGPAVPPPAAVPVLANGSQGASPKAPAQDAKAKATCKASPLQKKEASAPARTNGIAGTGAGATIESSISPIPRGDGNSGDTGEVRVAQYDYVPRESDKAQIPLRRHDFVRVFEITDSGWAAGVRLSRETMQEVGDAGWFPEGYLFPLTASGSKKD